MSVHNCAWNVLLLIANSACLIAKNKLFTYTATPNNNTSNSLQSFSLAMQCTPLTLRSLPVYFLVLSIYECVCSSFTVIPLLIATSLAKRHLERNVAFEFCVNFCWHSHLDFFASLCFAFARSWRCHSYYYCCYCCNQCAALAFIVAYFGRLLVALRTVAWLPPKVLTESFFFLLWLLCAFFSHFILIFVTFSSPFLVQHCCCWNLSVPKCFIRITKAMPFHATCHTTIILPQLLLLWCAFLRKIIFVCGMAAISWCCKRHLLFAVFLFFP